MVTLREASDTLANAGKAKLFIQCYQSAKFSDDAPLTDYLEFVRDEPQQWLQWLPESWRSASALDHAKAALTSVRCEPALMKELKASMHDNLNKEAIAAEVERRAPNGCDKNTSPTNDSASDTSADARSECRLAPHIAFCRESSQQLSLAVLESFEGDVPADVCLELFKLVHARAPALRVYERLYHTP